MKKQKSIIISLVFLIICVSIFLFVKYRNIESHKPIATINEHQKDLEKIKEIVKIGKDEVIYGSKDAKIDIIEYASYSCSHCATFHKNIIPKLEKELFSKNKVRLILRPYPLDEPSLKASMLVKCVKKKNRKKFIKALFSTQKNWAFNKNYPERLENLAKIMGLSGIKFHNCMSNSKIEEEILKSRLEASNVLMISSTPTLIINGQKYIGPISSQELIKYVNNLLVN
jgi:protein-disulfide isomerase